MNEMAFFPASFMLQTPHHQDDHHQPLPSLNSILPTCSPQDHYHGGAAAFLGNKRSMSFSGIEVGGEDQGNGGEEELSDDGSQLGGGGGGEKKRRLNTEQVKTLEKSFEVGNKLEPERKVQLARALGLQPRQVAIWFQNRRARWKTKQLEKDYGVLKTQLDALKSDNDALKAHNHKLQVEIMALKSREVQTESINLNKETEGSCSNRSDNSSDNKSITLFPIPSLSANNNNRSNNNNTGSVVAQLFQSTPNSRPELQLQMKMDPHMAKEESFSNMFYGIDDQSGFWPWLEHQHFN